MRAQLSCFDLRKVPSVAKYYATLRSTPPPIIHMYSCYFQYWDVDNFKTSSLRMYEALMETFRKFFDIPML